ncbi:MAG: YchJ family protein [Thiolinea sp.]
MNCPCQSGRSYQDCCAPLHDGKADAPTAEQLMRSRYSAYVLHKPVYLHRSWSAQTRPTKQSLKKAEPLNWLGLEIIRTERGGVGDNDGVVEFVARYQDGNEEAQLHETSRFTRESGRWVYVEGDY